MAAVQQHNTAFPVTGHWAMARSGAVLSVRVEARQVKAKVKAEVKAEVRAKMMKLLQSRELRPGYLDRGWGAGPGGVDAIKVR